MSEANCTEQILDVGVGSRHGSGSVCRLCPPAGPNLPSLTEQPLKRWPWLRALGSGLVALFCSHAVIADSMPRQLQAVSSPLAPVVASLGNATAEARLDFARLLVEALVEAYENELDPSIFQRRRNAPDRQKLARWHQAVQPLLSELRLAQANLYVASSVSVHLDRHQQVLLLIDGAPLWAAWPRIDAQIRAERDLAREFCQLHPCEQRPLDSLVASVWSPEGVRGQWVLSQRHPPTWETSAGLRCEFRDMSERADHEALCRAVVRDLEMLADALEMAMRGGERIQWTRLALESDPGLHLHQVIVNEQGDYLRLAVPALDRARVDWREAGRWLRARVHGEPAAMATVVRATNRGR